MAQTREERLEAQRRWRAQNKERIAEYNRQYAAANPGRMKAKNDRYRESHREELAAKQRERIAAMDPGAFKREKRAEYERNRDTYRDYAKRHYAENAEEEKRKARAWVEHNPARRREYLEGYADRRRELYYANHAESLAALHRRRGVRAEALELEILLGDPCAYCGGPTDTIDHIHPVSAEGDGEWENLTAACRSCNSGKHAKPMLHFLLERAA